MIGLTPKQAECLAFLKSYTAENGGVSPTVREIMDAIDLASSAGVQRLLKALEERGLIRRLRQRARAIEVLLPAAGAPLDLAALSVAELTALSDRVDAVLRQRATGAVA
ncbi:LexA family protein [Brevundimonas sp. LjRoot202]|uniref:LexA family protein n=1 Tax=Brevundimonas sp. LjRoot202 TaxID=3342281 RepID=UPI003ECC2095